MYIKELLSNKLNISISYVVILRMFAVILTFGLNFVIGNMLGAHYAGLYFQAYSIFMIFSLIGSFGLNNTVFIKSSQMASTFNYYGIKSILKKASLVIFFLSAILTLIIYCYDGLIDGFVSKESKNLIKVLILGLFPFIILNILSETLKAIKLVVLASFFQGFIGSFLLFISAFFLFYNNESLESFIQINVFIYWVLCLLGLIVLKKKLSHVKPKENKKIAYGEILNFSKYLFIISVISTILANIDIIILGRFTSETNIGLFGMALKVSLLISFILPSLNSVFVPIISNYYVKKDFVKLLRIAIKSSKIMALTSLPFILLVLFFNNRIMALFGEEFVSAGYVLLILTIGQFVRCLCASSGFIAMSCGKERHMAGSLVITLFIHLVLFFIVVPEYGIIGAAIVRTISMSLQDLYSAYLSKKILGSYPIYGLAWIRK